MGINRLSLPLRHREEGRMARRGDLNKRCNFDCYNSPVCFVVTSPPCRLFGCPRSLRSLGMTSACHSPGSFFATCEKKPYLWLCRRYSRSAKCKFTCFCPCLFVSLYSETHKVSCVLNILFVISDCIFTWNLAVSFHGYHSPRRAYAVYSGRACQSLT